MQRAMRAGNARSVGQAPARQRGWRVLAAGMGSLLLLGGSGTAVFAEDGADADDDGDDDGEGELSSAEVTTGDFEACEADFGYGKVVVAFDDPDFAPEQLDQLEVVPGGEAQEDCPAFDDEFAPNDDFWQDWAHEPPHDDGPWDLEEFEEQWFVEDEEHGVDPTDPPDGPYIYSAYFSFRSDADYRVDTVWTHPDEGQLGLSESFDACNLQVEDQAAGDACQEQALTNPVVFRVPEPEPGPACPPGEVPPAGFGDVPAGNVHADAIDCVAWYDIALGTGPDTYEPAAPVTRGQKASFVARLMRTAGMELPDVDTDAFDDVAGSTHAEAINQLAELGIVRGRDGGTFSPHAAVTRAQSSSLVVRALEEITGEPLPAPRSAFTDIGSGDHTAAIEAAAAAGIVKGTTPTLFEPGADTRRDQMASMLARTLEVLAADGHVQPVAD